MQVRLTGSCAPWALWEINHLRRLELATAISDETSAVHDDPWLLIFGMSQLLPDVE